MFWSNWFNIQYLAITGNKDIPYDQLRGLAEGELEKKKLFGLLPSSNLILVTKKTLAKEIESGLPTGTAVVIEKRLLGKGLTIAVEEFQPSLVLAVKEGKTIVQYLILDNSGKLVDLSNSLQKHSIWQQAPIVDIILDKQIELKAGETVISKELTMSLADLKTLWQRLVPLWVISKVTITSQRPDRIVVETHNGPDVYITEYQPLEEQLRNLQMFITVQKDLDWNKVQYIDARFGNKIYYK
ncbi:MAG: hypothetical protein V1707_01840 [bacterium]